MGPPVDVAMVRRELRRWLQEPPLGPPGTLVLAACSGGADSLALAGALAFTAPRLGLRAGGVTVDHGLQAGSAERAATVADTLRALGLAPVEVLTVAVGTEGGPEAAARTARYAALDAAAQRHGAAAVLLGHTRDDQAETVLLGLARGSGARSLAGMAPVAGRYRRPLLDLERAAVRRACAQMGLTPWEDPHNTDPGYTRVRVRHELLPAMERALGPGIAAALARTARRLRDDADALDALARDALAEASAGGPGLDTARLAALPRAVRTRVLRAAAIQAGSPAGTLAAVHVDALDALVTAWRGQAGADLPGGLSGRRTGGRLVFGPTTAPPGR